MAIYKYDGTELNAVYNLSGTQLEHAYDIDGEAVMESKYSINNVVEYFRSPTLSVASDVNNLSDDWQSFVFINDPHGAANKQHSQAIGMYLLDNTPVQMIILGGDYVSYKWNKTEYENYRAPFVNSNLMDNIYAIMGNHEVMGDSDAYVDESKTCIYNDFLKDKTNISGNLAENYYYLDNLAKKTRYMFINTSEVTQYTISSEQLSWIETNATLPDSTWSLIVFGHVSLNSMGDVTTQNETNGSAIVSAINQCNGTVVGYICGHQHIDLIYNDGDMYYTTLCGDLFSNTNWYDGYSITDRVSGTVSEQAVSVISFNTTTKDVVIRRIGAGRNMPMSYSYA